MQIRLHLTDARKCIIWFMQGSEYATVSDTYLIAEKPNCMCCPAAHLSSKGVH